MNNKLTISSSIEERDFIEGILNMTSAGYDGSCSVSMMFYVLLHSWHIDKFVYYNYLINEVKKTVGVEK